MKVNLNRLLLLILFFGIIFSCNEPPAENPTPIKPKYIFLFIGDGMGTDHVSLCEGYLGSAGGAIGMANLNMTGFPYFGLCSTFSANSNITDSGAAGSAIACGEKADNGVVSFFHFFLTKTNLSQLLKLLTKTTIKLASYLQSASIMQRLHLFMPQTSLVQIIMKLAWN